MLQNIETLLAKWCWSFQSRLGKPSPDFFVYGSNVKRHNQLCEYQKFVQFQIRFPGTILAWGSTGGATIWTPILLSASQCAIWIVESNQ